MANVDFPSDKFLTLRAEQCRSMALTFANPMMRDRMMDLALGYEKIAKAAAKLKIENIKIEELDTRDTSRPSS
jgi:hypothetical protein